MTSHTPKMLLVFCDGTGMDGNLTLADQTAGSDAKPHQPSKIFSFSTSSDAKPQQPTNVLRLARSIEPYSKDNRKRQIVLYLSGVGSEADFNSDPIVGAKSIQAFGTSVASKIRDAYAFLAQNYEDGDEICLFGFSRGAYTVRKVAGLIDLIGLLEKTSLGNLFGIWRDLYQHKTPTIPPGTRRPKIKCVGVWDTVGSNFHVNDALSIKDNGPLPNVEVALHALALQENRKEFLPTLWNQHKSGSLGPNQIFKQVWFPGAHSDVGGGYEPHELSDLALIWMVGEIESFINLDTGFIRGCLQLQPAPKPWGTSQPRNSFMETENVDKPFVQQKTRLENGDIHKDAMFHESLKFAPMKLDNPILMTIFNRLKGDDKFGSSWSPNWAPLNAFEKTCRDNWGKPPPEGLVTFTIPATLLNAPKAFAKL